MRPLRGASAEPADSRSGQDDTHHDAQRVRIPTKKRNAADVAMEQTKRIGWGGGGSMQVDTIGSSKETAVTFDDSSAESDDDDVVLMKTVKPGAEDNDTVSSNMTGVVSNTTEKMRKLRDFKVSPVPTGIGSRGGNGGNGGNAARGNNMGELAGQAAAARAQAFSRARTVTRVVHEEVGVTTTQHDAMESSAGEARRKEKNV